MEVVERLMTQSARLRETAHLPDPDYDRQIRENVTSLRKIVNGNALGDFASNDSLLDHFDPVADSLVYLFLLRIHIQALQGQSGLSVPASLLPPGPVWSRITSYLRAFDPIQVRYAGLEWRQLVEFVAQAAQAISQPIYAVRLVRDAMLRLDPSCAVFSSTHLLLVRLCLHAKTYACAVPVLDRYVCHFPASNSHATTSSSALPCAAHESSLSFITESSGLSQKLTHKDCMQYFLYGGMIYIALKDWSKASHFLQVVISMPTLGAVSKIMVEAYKKWILVNLLDKGKVLSQASSVSSLVSPNTVKVCQSLARPYVDLAYTFQTGDFKQLEAEVDAAREVWCKDNNMGLVSQVLNAYVRHTVMGIKQTFSALTVKELTDQASNMRISAEATESLIASLIMTGAVRATLVQYPGQSTSTMLRFTASHASSPLSAEIDAQKRLAQEGRSLRTLMSNVDEINNYIGLSNEFVDGMQKGQAWANMDDVHPGIGEDAGVDIDEDLMGEVS